MKDKPLLIAFIVMGLCWSLSAYIHDRSESVLRSQIEDLLEGYREQGLLLGRCLVDVKAIDIQEYEAIRARVIETAKP